MRSTAKRGAGAEDGDDDGEADGGFSGGDHHDKKDKDLAFHRVPLVGKGDKGKIDGVEHELNGHEDGDEIALDEKADDAERKEHGAQKQIPGERNVVLKEAHFVGRPFSDWPATGEGDGAEDGDEDEHRCDFKRQKQLVEEHLAEEDEIRLAGRV